MKGGGNYQSMDSINSINTTWLLVQGRCIYQCYQYYQYYQYYLSVPTISTTLSTPSIPSTNPYYKDNNTYQLSSLIPFNTIQCFLTNLLPSSLTFNPSNLQPLPLSLLQCLQNQPLHHGHYQNHCISPFDSQIQFQTYFWIFLLKITLPA